MGDSSDDGTKKDQAKESAKVPEEEAPSAEGAMIQKQLWWKE